MIGCASIQPLTGGDKDEQPPRVLSTSIDSAAINVSSQIFEFTFDEYIQQKQATEKLLISPNQAKPPTISVKKKKLTIELNDELLSNTTYTFQFNGAVTDINEGNPLENYNYIFSTGDYIDSAMYRGKVIDYITKKPCEKCNVHLYKNYSDTTILKNRPAYLARTDKAGSFTFNNLPTSLFTAIAIQDNNKNFFFDKEESISLPILINTDSSRKDSLYIFPNENTESYKIKLLKTTVPGTYNFESNKPITTDSITLLYNGIETDYTLSTTKDTLTAIYAQTKDTLAISLILKRDTFQFKNILQLSELKYNINTQISGNATSITIRSKTPLLKFDTSGINLILDSIINPYTIDKLDTFSFRINPSKSFRTAQVQLATNSLVDIYNKTNKSDTLNYRYTKSDPTSLRLDIQGDSAISYIIHIKMGNNIIRKTLIIGSKKLTYNDLKPGNYKVVIYTDTNNNGVWDTGNVFELRRPETITVSKEFEVRQNWDKELIINIE